MFAPLSLKDCAFIKRPENYHIGVSGSDDIEISALFLKNGVVVSSDMALWFYNSFKENGPYKVMGRNGCIGTVFNGYYTYKADENDPKTIGVMEALKHIHIDAGNVITLSGDVFEDRLMTELGVDEIVILINSKGYFYNSHIDCFVYKNHQKLDEFDINLNSVYPHAVGYQYISIYKGFKIDLINRASKMAMLEDYVNAVSAA